jgi:hypothetical protein
VVNAIARSARLGSSRTLALAGQKKIADRLNDVPTAP